MSPEPKSDIVYHFSNHGIMRTMGEVARFKLLDTFRHFFEAHNVIIPESPKEDIDLKAVKEILIALSAEEDDAMRLGDTLENIELLSRNIDIIQTEIDALNVRLASSLDTILPDRKTEMEIIVALCLLENKDKDFDLLVSRLAIRDIRGFHDYSWVARTPKIPIENDEQNEEEDENEKYDLLPFELPKIGEIAIRLAACEDELREVLTSKNMRLCQVHAFAPSSDGEIWILIEYGNRKKIIETLSPEENKVEPHEYLPVGRDVVVLDPNYKMMRIKAATDALDKQYKKILGTAIFTDENFFADKPVFNFEPLKDKELDEAFDRGVMRNFIFSSSVSAVKIRQNRGYDTYFVTLTGNKNVGKQWSAEFKDKGIIHTIRLKLQMRLSQQQTKSDSVGIGICRQGGLTVTKPKYTSIVREWLRRKGFLAGHTIPPLPRYTNEPSDNEQAENVRFWSDVASIMRQGHISMNQLYGEYPLTVAEFIKPFLGTDKDEQYAQLWYDQNGKCWDVHVDEGHIYRKTGPHEDSFTKANDVDIVEIELLKLDTKELITAIQKALFNNSNNLPGIKKDVSTGLFHLGRSYALRADCYLYLSGADKDRGYNSVLSRRKTSAKGECIFISVDGNTPAETRNMVDEDEIQESTLSELLTYGDKNLTVKIPISTYFHESNLKAESNVLSRWPLAILDSPSYHHITMKLNPRQCWIKYGEVERTFSTQDLEMFHQTQAGKQVENANYVALKYFYTAMASSPQGISLKSLGNSISTSTLSRLSKALSDFFGIQRNFYEPPPETAGKRHQLYQLAFAKLEFSD